MELLSTLDLVLIKVGLAGLLFAVTRSFIKRLRKPKARHTEFPLLTGRKATTEKALPPTRQIQQRLQQTGKTCVIFYGTQTGTAEKFALRLAKDASTRYNLQCLVADLDDYDCDDLSHFSPDQIAIFLLATYGEGEPTDNAIAFNEFLRARGPQQRTQTVENAAMQLQYAAFGLGNSSYQFYNSMIRRVDTVLQSCGATRIGDLGLGDDGKKTLEEDFAEWGAKTLAAIADHFHLRKLEYDFKPDFQVTESNLPLTADVFLGEPNKSHLRNKIQGPFTQTNPLPARIVEARELFNSSDRNCLHFEFDLAGTTLTYETGDHLAVWPVNSDDEVDRFLKVFGLVGRKNAVIDIKSRDLSVKVPIPAPTTYEAAARYYLDIGAPVPRPLLGTLAKIATREPVRSELLRLGSDGAVFQHEVAGRRLTLAQTLSKIAPDDSFHCVPFSFILENVGKLQPRFYSISSSALCARKRISITAVVNSASSPDPGFDFNGVNTHYLLALRSAFSGTPLQCSKNAVPKTHQINGPRGLFARPTALVHIRRSFASQDCHPHPSSW
jgi:NADPH-ferrihemoprotein reductase